MQSCSAVTPITAAFLALRNWGRGRGLPSEDKSRGKSGTARGEQVIVLFLPS